MSDMTLTKLLRVRQLNVTAHGFRSSFRDWAAEAAKARHEVAEACLAHAIKDKVVAAYLRASFKEERRSLMAGWADYCASSCGVPESDRESAS